jgi:asparagine synthase (glutamine-hydrolysing)
MTVGFTVFARASLAEFHLSDHGYADRPALVTQAENAGVRLVLIGRLYYRSDLRTRLDLTAQDARDLAQDCDAALALAAYQKDGLEGLERLEGDFTLAVWDSLSRRLICMREPTGGYPFFYTAHDGGILASTHMEPLLDARASSLDPEYLADYLMSPGLPLEDTTDGRTAYQGIQRLLPGSIAVFHLASGRVEQRRYWDWLERRVDPGTDDIAALGEQYLDVLRGAVRTRLRGRTASHLSGGIDSTGVALIARDCLQGREPVHALSLVYHKLPLLARERPYLESALELPGFTAHLINGDDALDFDLLNSAPPHNEPCPGLVRACASAQALIAAAAEAGAATVLTGIGADEIFDMQPYHLTEMLRHGRIWSAWSEASHWARARNKNVWEVLRPYGFDNLLPAVMNMGIGNWMRGGYAAWGRNSQWTVAPWIRPDFARRMDLRGRAIANFRRTFHACPQIDVSLALHSIRGCQDGLSRLHLAAPHGMMLTHPFFDRRAYSLGLGIKSRVRPKPGGGQKPILAAAMRGILPECILNRPLKGHFNESYFVGLSRNRAFLESLVEQAPVDDLGFLDKTILIDCLQRAALGNAGDATTMLHFEGVLSLLLWLTQRTHGQHSQTIPVRHGDAKASPMMA